MMQRLLGIDPGSLATGYSIIESNIASNRQANRHIASGRIELAPLEASARLAAIYDEVSNIISTYQPSIMVVEKVFMAKNAAAALKLGQARGVAICAGVKAGLAVHEYSARFVKKTITGNGAADKRQVKYMACRLLSIAERDHHDESDALAIALCHAFARPSANLAAAQRSAMSAAEGRR